MGNINSTLSLGITTGNGPSAQVYNTNPTISSNGIVSFSETLAVASPGTLTTRSSATAGTLTMGSIGSIITGCRLDIYWSGGVLYGATVGTVSGLSVPFTGGTGTLPAANTVITACVPTSVAFVVTGSNVVTLAVGVTPAIPATAVYATSGPVNEAAALLTTAIPSYVWASGYTGTNPISGDAITQVFISHSSTTITPVMSGFGQYN